MDSVYVVSVRDICDRTRIIQVFSKERDAEAYARIRNRRERDGYWVEEHDVAEHIGECFCQFPTYCVMDVRYLHKDDVAYVEENYATAYDNSSKYKGTDDGEVFKFHIVRKYVDDVENPFSQSDLLKIARNRYAQYKAMKAKKNDDAQWISDREGR